MRNLGVLIFSGVMMATSGCAFDAELDESELEDGQLGDGDGDGEVGDEPLSQEEDVPRDEVVLGEDDAGGEILGEPMTPDEVAARGLPQEPGMVWYDLGVDEVEVENVDGADPRLEGGPAPTTHCWTSLGIDRSGSYTVGLTARYCKSKMSIKVYNRLTRDGYYVAGASKSCYSTYCEVRTYKYNSSGNQKWCSSDGIYKVCGIW